jgi:hypothetical protein
MTEMYAHVNVKILEKEYQFSCPAERKFQAGLRTQPGHELCRSQCELEYGHRVLPVLMTGALAQERLAPTEKLRVERRPYIKCRIESGHHFWEL